MKSLYEMSNDYLNVMRQIEDAEGIMSDLQIEALDTIDEEFPVKVGNICKVIRNQEAESAAIKVELDRLSNRRKAKVNSVKRMKAYLFDNMQTLGHDKVETPDNLFTVAVQNSNPSAQWVGEANDIPDELRMIPPPPELDKKMVLTMAKAGTDLPDGCEVTRGKHLRIR